MKYSIKNYPDIAEKVKTMSTEELLVAVTCPNILDDALIPYRTTSTFFHMHNADNTILKNRMSPYNTDKNFPTLMVTDVENGAGFLDNGTTFPSMRALGKTKDTELAYKMGKISALEAGEAGFHWGYGPCVDIVGNIDNPIVNNRSIGSDVDNIIEMSSAVIAGMQENGLIATAKHFPGDGYCIYDQHLTTSENPLSKEDWEATYGRLYRELINRGVKSIMPGHISLPSMDDIDEETGAYRPATLSKKLLTDVLKNQLGFEGIIVSDATNMGGFCGYMNYFRACAEFLEAGGDILLFTHPTEEYITKLKGYMEEGILKRETLENRAYRTLCFTREHKDCISKEKIDRAEHQKVADEVTKRSIEIVRDRNKLLPIKAEKDMKVLYYLISDRGEEAIDTSMVEELNKHFDNVKFAIDLGPDENLRMVKEKDYELIICRLNPFQGYGLNTNRLAGVIARNMMNGWQKYDTPVVFITHSENTAHEYEMPIDTLINTSGYSLNSAKFILEKIFG